MIRLEKALVRLEADLRRFRLNWALIGGIAVSARSEPRTTQDLDAALAVEDDGEADQIVKEFLAVGYRMHSLLIREDTEGVIGTRLEPPIPEARGVLVDLFVGFSGIEVEVVAAAQQIEVLPGVGMPVATLGHLLALKTLAGRAQDGVDIQTLLRYAQQSDLQEAREALDLIERRGFGKRGVELQVELARYFDRGKARLG